MLVLPKGRNGEEEEGKGDVGEDADKDGEKKLRIFAETNESVGPWTRCGGGGATDIVGFDTKSVDNADVCEGAFAVAAADDDCGNACSPSEAPPPSVEFEDERGARECSGTKLDGRGGS